MEGKAFILFAGVVLATAPVLISPLAHCPGEVPTVKMQYPSEGVSIQEACFADFGSCFIDTFHTEKLKTELVDKYKASKYAILAYIDSVSNYLTYDTTYYRGEIYYIDTLQTEKVWISVHENLKEPLPVKGLTYVDRWTAFTGNPLATTYNFMIDTPFVAIFNEYDSIFKIGIGPMDGCFFEPTGYTIFQDRIHKKGLVGERMPGVSVPMADFLKAVGHEPLETPPVRPRSIGIRRRGHIMAPLLPGASPYRYDVNGRRFDAGKIQGRASSIWSLPGRETGPSEADGVSKAK